MEEEEAYYPQPDDWALAYESDLKVVTWHYFIDTTDHMECAARLYPRHKRFIIPEPRVEIRFDPYHMPEVRGPKIVVFEEDVYLVIPKVGHPYVMGVEGFKNKFRPGRPRSWETEW